MTRGPINEKTGNPGHDNRARILNRDLYRSTRRRVKVRGPNRRRNKTLKVLTHRQYMDLVYQVMLDEMTDHMQTQSANKDQQDPSSAKPESKKG